LNTQDKKRLREDAGDLLDDHSNKYDLQKRVRRNEREEEVV